MVSFQSNIFLVFSDKLFRTEWLPSWILERNNFSNSENLNVIPKPPAKVSDQSDIWLYGIDNELEKKCYFLKLNFLPDFNGILKLKV